MTKAVPAYHWQTQLPARRLQYAPQEILRVDWRSVAAGEHQLLWFRFRRLIALGHKRITNRFAHGHVSPTALCLGGTKLSLIDGLAYADHIMVEINVLP